MQGALSLAARGLGRVAPSPSVGCVLVKDGRILGRGRTGAGGTPPGGTPHAEHAALLDAGARGLNLEGATAYVTLEPCAHHGKTPPCADALIKSGVKRVVCALEDCDPRARGKGFRTLQEAGVKVEVGLCQDEALRLNAGFFKQSQEGRPLIALKMATGLDGRIAPAEGEAHWLTNRQSRKAAHLLRSRFDAIMVGSRTALTDDPSLTCRLRGLEAFSPIRIVADSHLALPLTSHLVRSAKEGPPVWLLALPTADEARRKAFEGCGVEVLSVPPDASKLMDMTRAAQLLGARGVTRLLLEGGGRLAASFLSAGLVDRLYWFHAPALTGGEGVAAIARLEKPFQNTMRVVSRTFYGGDVLLEADMVHGEGEESP